MPHLHAVHWMISSVVPVKLPVIGCPSTGVAVPAEMTPLVWLAVLLIARRSAAGRTWVEHVASDGSAVPGANVLKCPLAGTVVGGTVVVVGGTVVVVVVRGTVVVVGGTVV